MAKNEREVIFKVTLSTGETVEALYPTGRDYLHASKIYSDETSRMGEDPGGMFFATAWVEQICLVNGDKKNRGYYMDLPLCDFMDVIMPVAKRIADWMPDE